MAGRRGGAGREPLSRLGAKSGELRPWAVRGEPGGRRHFVRPPAGLWGDDSSRQPRRLAAAGLPPLSAPLRLVNKKSATARKRKWLSESVAKPAWTDFPRQVSRSSPHGCTGTKPTCARYQIHRSSCVKRETKHTLPVRGRKLDLMATDGQTLWQKGTNPLTTKKRAEVFSPR